MKININKIPEEGLMLTEQINPGSISLDSDLCGISFSGPVNAEARFTKSGREVFVDVSLEAPVEYRCARCLAKVKDVFRKQFNVSYEAMPCQVLEIDDDIRQEIILDYPVKVVCRPDCKGLCPNCGQNLNIGKCECNL